jgi:lipoate-protein ligase A
LRRAPGDVLVGETKVAGSAQRRSAGAVVQHGSILLARSASAPELPGINDLGVARFTARELIRKWPSVLAKKLAVSFEPSALLECERHRAERFVGEKYGADGWNRYRGRPPS